MDVISIRFKEKTTHGGWAGFGNGECPSLASTCENKGGRFIKGGEGQGGAAKGGTESVTTRS